MDESLNAKPYNVAIYFNKKTVNECAFIQNYICIVFCINLLPYFKCKHIILQTITGLHKKNTRPTMHQKVNRE